jgi:hypothetical protein
VVKKLIAEFLGPFALVFAGTGAVVINDVSGGAITHVGIALTFGLIVLAIVRLALALIQITGASVLLLISTGASRLTLLAAIVTGLFAFGSRILFSPRKQ